MKRSYSKKKVLLISFGIIVLFLFCNNRSVQVSQTDKQYLQLFLRNWHLNSSPEQVHKDFNSELSFISTVHDSIIAEIKHEEIAHRFYGDVSFYYNNRKGFCYDRAILMEKFLTYYHFPFRHVYLYFGDHDKRPGLFDIFKKNLTSHALTEVKTNRGWMAIGSNSNWLGIDSSGNLLTIGKLRQEMLSHHVNLRRKQLIGLEPLWLKEANFNYIYGIYSRNGDFFSHNSQQLSVSTIQPVLTFHLLPDYNLKMLLYNL